MRSLDQNQMLKIEEKLIIVGQNLLVDEHLFRKAVEV